jgi:hypothetical protein
MGKSAVEIRIDMDKKCVRCSEPGALENGYCMKCAAKMITEMSVGPQTLGMIKTQIDGLFQIHQREIHKALKQNGNELAIGFKVELHVSQNNQVSVQTGIDFTAQKIKDKSKPATIQEVQGGLFEV